MTPSPTNGSSRVPAGRRPIESCGTKSFRVDRVRGRDLFLLATVTGAGAEHCCDQRRRDRRLTHRHVGLWRKSESAGIGFAHRGSEAATGGPGAASPGVGY